MLVARPENIGTAFERWDVEGSSMKPRVFLTSMPLGMTELAEVMVAVDGGYHLGVKTLS
jgi:hypothetical protein